MISINPFILLLMIREEWISRCGRMGQMQGRREERRSRHGRD